MTGQGRVPCLLTPMMGSSTLTETGMSSSDVPPDVISHLPNNVTHMIMECLPIRDAAKMCLLSKKWRDTWPNLPFLVLDSRFFRDVLGSGRHNSPEFCRLVSKILLGHSGAILKFVICIPRLEQEPDIHQWVAFLSKRGIKEFTLENRCKSPLILPRYLYSCGNLTKLKLNYCIFHPPSSFKGFRNLVSLHLENIALQCDRFGALVARCPLLETLILRNWTGMFHLNIYAPKLKYLTISGAFHSICLHGSHDILSVSISMDEMTNICKFKAWELIRFLAGSCNVESLCFGGYFVKFLASGMIAGCPPVTFNHVKSLQLSTSSSSSELSCAIGIMTSCLNVEDLNVSISKTKTKTTPDVDKHNFAYDRSLTFPHLRNLNAIVASCSNSELELIAYLLSCSSTLEMFYLEIKEELDAKGKAKVSRKLMQLFKTSSKMTTLISMTGRKSSSESDFESDSDISSEEGSDSSDSSDYSTSYDEY